MSRRPGDLIVKDPQSIEPYGFDWTAWLAELGAGVTIASSSYRVSGRDTALTLTDDSILAGALQTQVRTSGGTRGARYRVTNRIVASTGDQDERSFDVLIQDR